MSSRCGRLVAASLLYQKIQALPLAVPEAGHPQPAQQLDLDAKQGTDATASASASQLHCTDRGSPDASPPRPPPRLRCGRRLQRLAPIAQSQASNGSLVVLARPGRLGALLTQDVVLRTGKRAWRSRWRCVSAAAVLRVARQLSMPLV